MLISKYSVLLSRNQEEDLGRSGKSIYYTYLVFQGYFMLNNTLSVLRLKPAFRWA